jgi:hypothetical protein
VSHINNIPEVLVAFLMLMVPVVLMLVVPSIHVPATLLSAIVGARISQVYFPWHTGRGPPKKPRTRMALNFMILGNATAESYAALHMYANVFQSDIGSVRRLSTKLHDGSSGVT